MRLNKFSHKLMHYDGILYGEISHTSVSSIISLTGLCILPLARGIEKLYSNKQRL
jgi:hypothetical protein